MVISPRIQMMASSRTSSVSPGVHIGGGGGGMRGLADIEAVFQIGRRAGEHAGQSAAELRLVSGTAVKAQRLIYESTCHSGLRSWKHLTSLHHGGHGVDVHSRRRIVRESEAGRRRPRARVSSDWRARSGSLSPAGHTQMASRHRQLGRLWRAGRFNSEP